MADGYVQIFYDWPEATQELNAQEKGRLIDAIVLYARGGSWQELIRGSEKYVFPTFKLQVDRAKAKQDGKSETNRENGRKGGRPQKDEKANGFFDDDEKPKKANGFFENRKKRTVFSETEKTHTKDKDKEEDKDKDKEEDKDKDNRESLCARAREAHPTVAQVADYARELGAEWFDADVFVDYHAQNNWLVRGSPMQDWRAAVRLWVKREAERQTKTRENPALAYQQRDYGKQDNGSFFIDLEKEYGNEQFC